MITVIALKGNEVLDFESVPDDGIEEVRVHFVNICESTWGVNSRNIDFRYWKYSKHGKVTFLPNRI